MKPSIPILLTFALATALYAQDPAPELAPLVAKHEADLAALEALKATAVTHAQQPYVFALDGAEKSATTASALDVVAAISKEREALKSGLMAPAFPEGLPKTLQSPRKACLDAVARVATDAAPRQKAIDADYLRALATLQPKAAANPELAKQIAAEKEKLLAGAGGGAADKKPAAGSSRNAIINGTFDVAGTGGLPAAWQPGGGPECFKVVREGANVVLHATVVGAPRLVSLDQIVPVPPRAKTMLLRGRVRGKASAQDPSDTNWGANINARFIGSDDRETGGWTILNGGHDAAWKTLSKSAPVPNGAKAVKILCAAQQAVGDFDFDDIEVEFR